MWIKSYLLNSLSQVISKLNVTHHLNFDSSMEELIECLELVQERMDGVQLKLNPQKLNLSS